MIKDMRTQKGEQQKRCRAKQTNKQTNVENQCIL